MKSVPAMVKEVIKRTSNVKSIRVENPGKDYKAGQFLRVTLTTDPECTRYLSISSSPTEKDHIEFTKKLTQSDFSRALDSLKPGDMVHMHYPFGKFTLDSASTKIAFLSGGIGITPIRSMYKYAVDKRLDSDMVLVYANRSIRDIVFKEDFDLMQKQHPGLRVAHVLCEPAPGFTCTIGLINSQIVRNEVPDYALRKFYVCGPPAMVESMKGLLAEELCVPEDRIVTERFQGY
ncbi:MAG: FAD-binding oxidoreductase [Candidatus Aureabacteria bacterium]|nr:FAD-binding oxidoreductase [Candidatus Auribacterota bacterium]